jgi:hypothetical protein
MTGCFIFLSHSVQDLHPGTAYAIRTIRTIIAGVALFGSSHESSRILLPDPGYCEAAQSPAGYRRVNQNRTARSIPGAFLSIDLSEYSDNSDNYK